MQDGLPALFVKKVEKQLGGRESCLRRGSLNGAQELLCSRG